MFQSFKFICGEFLGIPTALHASNAWGTGSIPGQGTKILHAMWYGQPPPPHRKKKKNKNKKTTS